VSPPTNSNLQSSYSHRSTFGFTPTFMLDPAVPLSSMLALLSFKSDNRCRRSLPKLQLQQDVADAGACLAHHFSCVCSKKLSQRCVPS